ncbi:MAG: class II fumarate hydratase [Desulfatirhabdiaceae bacterium]
MAFREEIDTMGKISVDSTAYYGPATQRAMNNFPISGLNFPLVFYQHMAIIKKAAAITNTELGLLEKRKGAAIAEAAQDIIDGKLKKEFVVDVFQTGSGTSTHMNMNEVIASRANEILTGIRGGKSPVHPNDHVNMGQSSNDVFPSTIHISALTLIKNELIIASQYLKETILHKANEFNGILKIARTHVQDALPITLGQEFFGFASHISHGIRRLESIETSLSELSIGGTAVGNGDNTHPKFALKVIDQISSLTGIKFREAENHFEAQSGRDAIVETSGVLKTLAVSLTKIANDIRWLSSGPRCGLGEISLPDLQPGSSIMPGKINPVIPEVVIQVAAQVIGNDTVITLCGQGGNFQLNTMMPVMAYNLLQSISLLTSASRIFAASCISGIQPNIDKCRDNIHKSLALVTYLVPLIGYDRAAEIAKKAFETGQTIYDAAGDESDISPDDLEIYLGGRG